MAAPEPKYYEQIDHYFPKAGGKVKIASRSEKWPPCVPFPFPEHWRVDDLSFKLMEEAEPFLRPPDNQPHPDILKAKNGTIVRGEFIRNKSGTTRVPDVTKSAWQNNGMNRPKWRINWDKTGDCYRTEAEGPAPPGWSSFQRGNGVIPARRQGKGVRG